MTMIGNRDALRAVFSALTLTARVTLAVELWRLSARCYDRGHARFAFYDYHRGGQWCRVGDEIARLAPREGK